MKSNLEKQGSPIAALDGRMTAGMQGEANDGSGPASAQQNLPEYDTETLFAGGREIVIHHAGAAYRMKITKQGKLILNK